MKTVERCIMKRWLSLLLLTFVLSGCSYYEDVNEIHDKNTEKAEEVLQKHSDRLEELNTDEW